MHAESSNLNIMRAMAVLAVFVAHFYRMSHDTNGLWNIGHVGVLLFFVHTSLVLMMSLERQDRSGEHLRWLRFMTRRVFRIYPLAIVAVGFYGLTGITAGPGAPVIHLRALDRASNFLLTQNLTYSPSVPGVLWSLPYEMQMYLMLPAIYVIARKADNLRWMLVLWIAACVAGLGYVHLPYCGRFNVLDYAPCFLPGTIAFCLLKKQARFRLPALLWVVSLLGAVAAFMFAPKGWDVPKWALCIAMGLALPFFSEVKVGFLTRPAAFIAKYSYGIYLFHMAALWLVFNKLPPMMAAAQFLLALGVTLLIAAAVFHAIEQPMIGYGARCARLLVGVNPEVEDHTTNRSILSQVEPVCADRSAAVQQ